METITVRLPSRAWAEAAVEDLNRAGCLARLACEREDPEGMWAVEVTGTADQVREIRLATAPPCPKVDWESFVNACDAGGLTA